MSYEYKSGTQLLEERYVTFGEVGLIGPDQSASKLWAWGFNGNSGNLGLSTRNVNVSSPTQVGSLTTWQNMSTAKDDSNIAIKTDGTLWAWGYNAFGQLGLGNRTATSSPVQVGLLTNWKLTSGGNIHSAAIKTDGTLWAWGSNTYGQLGLGSTTSYSSPVQVGSLTNWKLVSAGGYHTTAIKTDGTLWVWGRNNFGQLGRGNVTSYSSPVQVGSLTDWKLISAGGYQSISIKTDGTLWAWGENYYGSLGLSDLIHRSSPVQVGTLTNWKQVTSTLGTVQHSTLAVKTDGTLWGWGHNGWGQLGLGSELGTYSSPTQIGTLTNWKNVSCQSRIVSGAVKTDGTLWAWGKNDYGQLGQGDTVHRPSPIQIGSLSNWKSVYMAYGSVFALQLNS